MAFPRASRVVLPVTLLLAIAGCGDREGVRSYTVPRASEKSGPGAAAGEYRILGAAYPAESPVWYFKLTGPAAELAKHEADFDAFIASVKLPGGDAVPTFTLPNGWTRGGPRSVSRGGITVRFDETIKIDALELTISQSTGTLVGNVDRWSGQVGGAEVHSGNVSKFTREVQAAGGKGIRVDVKGPKNPAAGGPMMGGGRK